MPVFVFALLVFVCVSVFGEGGVYCAFYFEGTTTPTQDPATKAEEKPP